MKCVERKTMSNPNNCSTCGHKQNPDGGYCYMFKDEPSEVCMQHTGRIDTDQIIINTFGFLSNPNSRFLRKLKKALV